MVISVWLIECFIANPFNLLQRLIVQRRLWLGSCVLFVCPSVRNSSAKQSWSSLHAVMQARVAVNVLLCYCLKSAVNAGERPASGPDRFTTESKHQYTADRGVGGPRGGTNLRRKKYLLSHHPPVNNGLLNSIKRTASWAGNSLAAANISYFFLKRKISGTISRW